MIKLKLSIKYCIALYCITMLYASFHELVHHISGFMVCGDWGYKSFNYFETACEDSDISLLATYTGPIFSFAMMYLGMLWLNSPISFKRHLGFATIFAQLPFQRMVMPLFKMNDEFYATAQLFGNNQLVYWMVFSVVFLICTPPLVKAYECIENRNRMFYFLLFYTLLPYLVWAPIFGLLEFLMVNKKILDYPFFGIGLLFIINEIVTIILYLKTKKYLQPKK